jgi:hypothetical protein
MLEIISELSKSDAALLKLLGKAQEYADLYLIAKKRQKGCDGLGEMTNLKDEFGVAAEELLVHRRSDYQAGRKKIEGPSFAKAKGNLKCSCQGK